MYVKEGGRQGGKEGGMCLYCAKVRTGLFTIPFSKGLNLICT